MAAVAALVWGSRPEDAMHVHRSMICAWCGATAVDRRSDALWCSGACKMAGRRYLRRLNLGSRDYRAQLALKRRRAEEARRDARGRRS